MSHKLTLDGFWVELLNFANEDIIIYELKSNGMVYYLTKTKY